MAPGRLSRADMVADLAELMRLLESAHPDPYAAGGGMVAFHRRSDAVLRALPAEGLTAVGFLRRLRPLVAAVGDGHTTIGPADPEAVTAPRLWLGWGVVEDCLYLATVHRQQDRPLLGARLRAVAGVEFADLVRRTRCLVGVDNPHDNLRRLVHALGDPTLLAALLEVDEAPARVRVDLEGTPPVTLPLSAEPPGEPLRPESTLTLPPLDAADLGWGFLGDTALLRIASMARYREAFEHARSRGPRHYLDQLPLAGGGLDERIAAVPSATEALRGLFGAMRERRTPALIVDLRDNGGGNSLLALILAYFLRGADVLATMDAGYQIPRHSALYRVNHPGAAQPDGYDFSQEADWRSGRQGARQALQDFVAAAPTFARELAAGTWGAAWTPRVIAVTSAFTYSAGFDCARVLHGLGASLLGVASAQSGNAFTDALQYTLPRSGLRGGIAYKRSLMYPDDPGLGRVLRPARELTYRDLRAMAFDPNASLRVALEQVP